MARPLGQWQSERFGQSVIIENRLGDAATSARLRLKTAPTALKKFDRVDTRTFSTESTLTRHRQQYHVVVHNVAMCRQHINSYSALMSAALMIGHHLAISDFW